MTNHMPIDEITVPASQVREGDLVVRVPTRMGDSLRVNRLATFVEAWTEEGPGEGMRREFVTIRLADDGLARNGRLNLAPERDVVIVPAISV